MDFKKHKHLGSDSGVFQSLSTFFFKTRDKKRPLYHPEAFPLLQRCVPDTPCHSYDLRHGHGPLRASLGRAAGAENVVRNAPILQKEEGPDPRNTRHTSQIHRTSRRSHVSSMDWLVDLFGLGSSFSGSFQRETYFLFILFCVPRFVNSSQCKMVGCTGDTGRRIEGRVFGVQLFGEQRGVRFASDTYL